MLVSNEIYPFQISFQVHVPLKTYHFTRKINLQSPGDSEHQDVCVTIFLDYFIPFSLMPATLFPAYALLYLPVGKFYCLVVWWGKQDTHRGYEIFLSTQCSHLGSKWSMFVKYCLPDMLLTLYGRYICFTLNLTPQWTSGLPFWFKHMKYLAFFFYFLHEPYHHL